METELKLLFPAEARALLDRHPALRGEGGEQHLVSTYHDTPDGVLAAAGLTLRVRRSGERRVQTVKALGTGEGVLARRGEWEWPLPGDEPDLSLLAGTPAGELLAGTPAGALLAGTPGAGERAPAVRLRPVFTTDVHRSTRRLLLGDAEVEAALDEGSIRAGTATEPVRELELELKSGSAAALYRVALELHGAVPLQLGVESKSARGRRLRAGERAAAVPARAPRLRRGVGAAEGLRQVVAAGLGALLRNRDAAGRGDAEGVHQMRVAARRLRAALVLFAPHLEPHAAARFGGELRRLGRVLGEARDWDVFCAETLPEVLGGAGGEAEGEAGAGNWGALLGAPAAAEREAAHARLRAELAGPALTGLALGLAAWVEGDAGGAGLHGSLAGMAPALLGRLGRRAVRRGRHPRRRSGEELHVLRKALKKLRYGADPLRDLLPRRAAKAGLKRCRAVQELLGGINDAATAVALTERLGERGGPALAPALAVVARWAEERRHAALRRLPKAWHAFRDELPFWEKVRKRFFFEKKKQKTFAR